MSQSIPLANAPSSALVDDGDYAALAASRWSLKNGYAARTVRRDRRVITLYMHRVILDAAPGQICDHVNGDKLDNRRENLRLVTSQQNHWNRQKNHNNRSGYKGVRKYGDRWKASIKVSGRSVHLGYHDSAELAALLYDHAARRFYGPFARLNFDAPIRLDYDTLLDQILAGEQPKKCSEKPPLPKQKSHHRGVYWERGRWRAAIWENGRKRHLGYFYDEDEAARAYERAAPGPGYKTNSAIE
jgi:hypothetical protein